MKEEFRIILIEKQLKGIANEAERAELAKWQSESVQNQRHFEDIALISKATTGLDFNHQPNTKAQWDALKNELGVREAKIVSMKPRFSFLRIAATVVVLLGVGWLINTQLLNADSTTVAQEYIIEKGKMERIELSDGTIVHLNSDSKLAVFKGFNDNNRRVQLIGEAYFEVAKDKTKPFLIATENVTTRVVGTAFNISAYPEDPAIEINVTEGIVEFSDSDEQLRLTAEKAAIFNKKEGVIAESKFEINETNWMGGELIFKNKSLAEILKSLERKFDVNIKDQSNSSERMLTEMIEQNDTPEDVFNRLAKSANLTWKKEGNSFVFKEK